MKLVYNSPFRFHLQPLFETFFAPVNIKLLTLEMPAEAHVVAHEVFVIVRFQPQMKYLDIFYLDLPILHANNAKLMAQFLQLEITNGPK